MRIMVVCGFGLGSSMILKLKLDEVLQANNLKATTFCSDLTMAKSETFDMLFTSKDISNHFKDVKKPVVVISNFLNKTEIAEKGLEPVRQLLASES